MSDKSGCLDISREVASFLSGYDRLVRLPLMSDAEMDCLFSPEMQAVLASLAQYDRKNKICLNCSYRCCGLIKCEMYDAAFGACPVFHLRPLLCRMQFCHKFQAFEKKVKIIGDIFLESLLAAARQGNPKAALFDSPSLAPAAPRLAGKMLALTAAFREGKLDPAAAAAAILAEAENYRIPL